MRARSSPLFPVEIADPSLSRSGPWRCNLLGQATPVGWRRAGSDRTGRGAGLPRRWGAQRRLGTRFSGLVVLGRAKTARHRMGVAVCTTRLAAGATIGFGGGFFDLAAVDQCCSGDVGRLRLALGYLAFAMMVWGVQT